MSLGLQALSLIFVWIFHVTLIKPNYAVVMDVRYITKPIKTFIFQVHLF